MVFTVVHFLCSVGLSLQLTPDGVYPAQMRSLGQRYKPRRSMYMRKIGVIQALMSRFVDAADVIQYYKTQSPDHPKWKEPPPDFQKWNGTIPSVQLPPPTVDDAQIMSCLKWKPHGNFSIPYKIVDQVYVWACTSLKDFVEMMERVSVTLFEMFNPGTTFI